MKSVSLILQRQMENLQADRFAREQAFSSRSRSNILQLHHDQTPAVRTDDSCENVPLLPETSAASQLSVSSSTPVHSLSQLHEELEESRQGSQPTSEDPGPSVSSNTLRPSSPAHVNNIIYHPPNLLHLPAPVHQDTASPLNIKPVALFADVSSSFHMPRFNPSWPVLVPHLSPNILSNASVPRHNPFCPIYTPRPFKASFTALVACEDPSCCSRVFRPHLKVYPSRAPLVQVIRTDGEAQDCLRLWQRLGETARLFCSSTSDAEALACFFTRVIPSLSVHRPDLPFIAAVNAAVQEWKNISVSEREPYYNTARMFTEMEKQDKSANRAEEDPTIPQTDIRKGRRSGKVKKTGKRSKKGVQDLAEAALAEYTHVMDSLEPKVSDGSEVTAAEEEDVCALFLNQLLDNSESTTEAGFDLDYISSLLSTDVLKDDSQDTLSSVIPEPVAGCSDWTHTAVSGAPSAVQHDFRSSDGTNHMMESLLVPFQDNIKGQNVLQTLTQPLLANPEGQSSQTDPNASAQVTPHPDLQDFGPDVDGNQKDETSYAAELDSAAQSNCFSLQNYNSHHATFPHAVKHDPEPPKPPVDDRVEHDGEKNMVVGQKTEKCMHVGRAKDNNNMDSDIPNDSQRTRSTKQTLPNIEENNVHKNKKHNRRQKHQRIARTSPKLDDKDKTRLKTAVNGRRKTQRKSANAMKHEARAQETDSKVIVKKVELQQHANITETRSSAMGGGNVRQHDAQIRKIRGEHLEDESERRQRRLKTVRRVGEQRTATSRKTCRSKKTVLIFVAKRANDYKDERRDQTFQKRWTK